MVKQQINENAGRRNIQPNRIRIANNVFVTSELIGHGIKHRPQNERQNDERKSDVRYQKEKINVSNRALAAEFIRRIRDVIKNIANQK